MTRFLTKSLVACALILSVAGAYGSVAHAQQPSGAVSSAPATAGQTTAPSSAQGGTVSGTNNPVALQNNQPAGSTLASVMVWVMSLFAWLLGVAAITLDNAVFYTVVTMGDYVSKLSAVGVTWRILRDIGNIVIIFGFLSIGIAVILDVKSYGATKMLPMLLIAAVFLNFSLFISEAVIDVGNLFATEFYTQINGGYPAQPVSLLSLSNIHNEGISNKIMSQLGLATIYGDALNPQNGAIYKASSIWLIGFMAIILFMVAAFVMFSLAFILIARFVTLIFLIILAPVGFAGLAVPKLEKFALGWWDALFNQTITAPILLLLLYIALSVITDTSFLTGLGVQSSNGGAQGAWTGFMNNSNLPGFASVMLSFIVAMGLLFAVILAAKKMSAAGAGWATKGAGALTFGLVAAGGRRTIGKGSEYLSRRVRTSSFKDTKRGRLLAGTFDRGAKASFDVRASSSFNKIPFGGINAGDAQKGGYKATKAASVKGHLDYIKSVTEAIDERGATKGEKARQEEAKLAEAYAMNAQFDANKEYMKHKAEVDRLAAINKENRDKGIFDQKNTNDLKAAQQNLETSKLNLEAANAKRKEAAEELKKAEDAEKNRTGQDKQKAQEAYAANISGLSSIISGSGGPTAAKKIIKDAMKKKKSESDELYEKLKKAWAEETKTATEGEAKKTTASAPAAGAH